ncbi:riboflavin synthase [bacterium]|nr:riboflavin synthase [bacterium]
MFTGIIEAVVKVDNFVKGSMYSELAVTSPFPAGKIDIGDSIAVNGVCLTVSQIKNNSLFFQIQNETIKKTYFSKLKHGDILNLERALPVDGRLNGHIVQGHVDETGYIVKNQNYAGNWIVEIKTSDKFMRYIVHKGSVSIDGISLTVTEKKTLSFTVNLIPHTMENTNLKSKKINDPVNLEADILSKYIYNFLLNTRSSSNDEILKNLKKGGFIS